MLKNNDFVIITVQLDDIAINSVGIIKALNGSSAMVLFIGANELKKWNLKTCELLIFTKQARDMIIKFATFAIY